MITKDLLNNVFENIYKVVDLETCQFSLILSFSNEENNFESFIGGVRFLDKHVTISLVNLSQSEIRCLYQLINSKKIEQIFVDTDKKLPFEVNQASELKKGKIEFSNIIAEVTNLFSNLKIIPFSSTSITVNSVMNKLHSIYGPNLSGKKISLVGIGSIGFQLALELIREGVSINAYTKNYDLGLIKCNCINEIKSKYTLASISLFKDLRTIMLSSSILIDCSSAENIFGNELFNEINSLNQIIAVGKKSFSPQLLVKFKNDSKIKRLDVSDEIIKMVINSKQLHCELTEPKKRNYLGKTLISGGWKGQKGEIVVNDADDPLFVLGKVKDNGHLEPIYIPFSEFS